MLPGNNMKIGTTAIMMVQLLGCTIVQLYIVQLMVQCLCLPSNLPAAGHM